MIAHGEFSQSVNPVRVIRTGNLAPARKSKLARIYSSLLVCITRRKGNELGFWECSKDQKYILQKLGARHLLTEKSTDSRYAWTDWFRIPIRPGNTWYSLQRILESRQIFQIFCGYDNSGIASHVFMGKGTGVAIPGKMGRLLRERYKECNPYRGIPARLLARLGIDLTELVAWQCELNPVQIAPSDWPMELPVSLWVKLCQKHSLFQKLWYLLSMLWVKTGMDSGPFGLAKLHLDNWCRRHIRDRVEKPYRYVHNSELPISWDYRNNPIPRDSRGYIA